MHIRVLCKQFRDLVIPKLTHLAPDRHRYAAHRILAFHGGQRKKTSLDEPAIESLALRRQKVQAVFITVHHVDGGGDRQALIVHGGNDGRVDLIHNKR